MPRGIEGRSATRSASGTLGLIACLGLLAAAQPGTASAEEFPVDQLVRPDDYRMSCDTDAPPRPIMVPDGIQSVRVFMTGCICGFTVEQAKKNVAEAQYYTGLDDDQSYEQLVKIDIAPSEESKQLTLYCYTKATLVKLK
jgi:hypothetical protein